MKSLFFLIAILSSSYSFAAQKSPAEVISEFAKKCYEETTVQVSIGLSQAFHNANPGSKTEKMAKIRMDQFSDRANYFPVFETGCNEVLDGDEKFICYSQGYSAELKRISKIYAAKTVLTSIPDCAFLRSVQ